MTSLPRATWRALLAHTDCLSCLLEAQRAGNISDEDLRRIQAVQQRYHRRRAYKRDHIDAAFARYIAGLNAQGVAARHTDATGHATDVEVIMGVHYSQAPAAGGDA